MLTELFYQNIVSFGRSVSLHCLPRTQGNQSAKQFMYQLFIHGPSNRATGHNLATFAHAVSYENFKLYRNSKLKQE